MIFSRSSLFLADRVSLLSLALLLTLNLIPLLISAFRVEPFSPRIAPPESTNPYYQQPLSPFLDPNLASLLHSHKERFDFLSDHGTPNLHSLYHEYHHKAVYPLNYSLPVLNTSSNNHYHLSSISYTACRDHDSYEPLDTNLPLLLRKKAIPSKAYAYTISILLPPSTSIDHPLFVLTLNLHSLDLNAPMLHAKEHSTSTSMTILSNTTLHNPHATTHNLAPMKHSILTKFDSFFFLFFILFILFVFLYLHYSFLLYFNFLDGGNTHTTSTGETYIPTQPAKIYKLK